MQGTQFGGPLERLRQAARVDVPRLAHEYSQVRDGCETSSSSDGLLDRSDYFGSPALKSAWAPLRDVIWTAAGETGANLWALSQGLESALDGFIHEDTAAAGEMNRLRGKLEGDKTEVNDEWKAGYDDGAYPGKK